MCICLASKVNAATGIASLVVLCLLAGIALVTLMGLRPLEIGSRERFRFNLVNVILGSVALFFSLVVSAALGSDCFCILNNGMATISSDNFSNYSLGFSGTVAVLGPIVSIALLVPSVLRFIADKRAMGGTGKRDVEAPGALAPGQGLAPASPMMGYPAYPPPPPAPFVVT
jgi:hypothetical protein